MEVLIDGVRYKPMGNIITPVDFPKLLSPFKRDETSNYKVRNEIEDGYEWVFEDDNVVCTEKINGEGISIVIQDGQLISLWNRNNSVPIGMFVTNYALMGIRNAYMKKRIDLSKDGQVFGELMGPNIQGNFLQLDEQLWFPFEYLREKFSYKSWGKYLKDFDSISKWFQNDIFSLSLKHYQGSTAQPEGVVFYQPSTGNMAKLRLDMFDWYKK